MILFMTQWAWCVLQGEVTFQGERGNQFDQIFASAGKVPSRCTSLESVNQTALCTHAPHTHPTFQQLKPMSYTEKCRCSSYFPYTSL